MAVPDSLRLVNKHVSAYPREWDYARFRKIADSCSALLMCDMAHIRYIHFVVELDDAQCLL